MTKRMFSLLPVVCVRTEVYGSTAHRRGTTTQIIHSHHTKHSSLSPKFRLSNAPQNAVLHLDPCPLTNNLSFLFSLSFNKQNYPSWVLFLKHSSDEIKWVWGYIRLTSLNNMPYSIKVDHELCKITGAEVFTFLHSCGLEWWSRSLTRIKMQSSVASIIILSLYEIWS